MYSPKSLPGTTVSPSFSTSARIVFSILISRSVAERISTSSFATILIPSSICEVVLFEIALLTTDIASLNSKPSHLNFITNPLYKCPPATFT